VGVHAAYQVALAAEEMGRLDRFYCSLLDAPGKWGGLLSLVLGADRLVNRRVPGLPPGKVTEHPWPFFGEQVRTFLRRARPHERLQTCEAFDRWLADQLRQSGSRLFYGVDVCAELAFRVAHERGMTCVLECPGIHPAFLQSVWAAAGKPRSAGFLSRPLNLRKLRAYAQADVLLTHSDIHTRSFLEAGFPRSKIIQISCGVNPSLFHAEGRLPVREGEPLRALFVGRITMLKGVPWLWEALQQCPAEVRLTAVGPLTDEGRDLIARAPRNVTYRSPVSKPVLRAIYQEHDVLVLPSLIETFGNVVMEAMACGLPVILTDHCGAPVPDESWRVPVRDGAAIAERLAGYAGDRGRLARDGEKARAFVRKFDPVTVRRRMAAGFGRLLGCDPAP
jgi:glycosyltransferase involved in cell wall biosynthesis